MGVPAMIVGGSELSSDVRGTAATSLDLPSTEREMLSI
jgi:hypothetical protein